MSSNKTLFGFHAVSVRLKTHPESVIEIHVDATRRDQRMRQSLVAAIHGLPEREQHVMSMYYEQDMNLKEIASVLGVTESRVCQLHSQSIARLRAKMRSH